jgi:hypothetical protein
MIDRMRFFEIPHVYGLASQSSARLSLFRLPEILH